MMRALILILFLMLSMSASARGRYSILQGTTSDTVTHFTVVAPKNKILSFEVIDVENNNHNPSKVEEVQMDGSDWSVRRMRFENLTNKKEFVLLVKDQFGQILEARSFALLDRHAKTGKVGVASCMMRFLHNSLMWDTMRTEENRPDLFLFTGDAVYLDRINPLVARVPETELVAWEEFVRTRNTVEFYFWDHLVPVFSIWDDHDSGGDGVNATNYPLMPAVHRIYDTFFANEPIAGFVERGPGLSLNFKLYGQNFIMLDGRSFRNLDKKSLMFGEDQERWLLDKVENGSNVLVNGGQFFGKYLAKDSFEYNYPTQFGSFIAKLKAQGERKQGVFTFVSGDIHFSELLLIEPEFFGYPTFEITSSSAHSSTFPGRHVLIENPRRLEVTSTHNIINLELAHAPGHFAANVKSMGWRGNILFERFVSTAGVVNDIFKTNGLRDSKAAFLCKDYLPKRANSIAN